MFSRDTTDYYERRAKAANKLAEDAASPGIRKIHLKMAQSYDRLASEDESHPRHVLSLTL